MQPSGFRCLQCGLSYANTMGLGRHLQSFHHQAEPILPRISESEPKLHAHTQTLIAEDGYIALLNESGIQFLQNEPIDSNIADEVISFYEDLHDSWTPVYENVPVPKYQIQDICSRALRLLKFCCSQHLTRGQISAQYKLMVDDSSVNCNCASEFNPSFLQLSAL
eukprot:IDg5186t1